MASPPLDLFWPRGPGLLTLPQLPSWSGAAASGLDTGASLTPIRKGLPPPTIPTPILSAAFSPAPGLGGRPLFLDWGSLMEGLSTVGTF